MVNCFFLEKFGLRQALDQIAKFPSTLSLGRVFLAPDIYRFPQGMRVSPQLCETRIDLLRVFLAKLTNFGAWRTSASLEI